MDVILAKLCGHSQIEGRSEINVEASSTHFHTTTQLGVRVNDRPYFQPSLGRVDPSTIAPIDQGGHPQIKPTNHLCGQVVFVAHR